MHWSGRSDEELVKQAKEWSILGKDLVAQVTCAEPYEWQGLTDAQWEFSPDVQASNGSEPLHVRPFLHLHLMPCSMSACINSSM